MARPKGPEQLELLRRQQIELAKKIKEAESKARERSRQDEQRRETLVGRLMLTEIAEHPDSDLTRAILAQLNVALTRPADRVLFPALPAREEAPAASDDEPLRFLSAKALAPADGTSAGSPLEPAIASAAETPPDNAQANYGEAS